ncbi:MAG: hypothetical protein ACREOZ_03345 [Gloeomargaritales cyanobacterium]
MKTSFSGKKRGSSCLRPQFLLPPVIPLEYPAEESETKADKDDFVEVKLGGTRGCELKVRAWSG